MKNQYLNYHTQSIQTMTSGEMIQALFEGMLKQCYLAISHIEQGRIVESHNSIVRAQDIVLYMTQTLNPSVDISNRLFLMYDYFGTQLTKANIEKQTAPLIEIIPFIEELKDTFSMVYRTQRIQSNAK